MNKTTTILMILAVGMLVLAACQSSGDAARTTMKAQGQPVLTSSLGITLPALPQEKDDKLLLTEKFDLAEPEILQEMPQEFSVPTNAKTLDKPMLPTSDCFVAYQHHFPQGYDLHLNYESGCIELGEDIYFSHTLYMSGGFTFDGKGHTIFSNDSMETTIGILASGGYWDPYGNTSNATLTIRDVKVTGKSTGFEFYNSVHGDQLLSYGNSIGFITGSNTEIIDSVAHSNSYYGFFMYGGLVQNSIAYNNGNVDTPATAGFMLHGFSSVENSQSYDNLYHGFRINGAGTVSASEAYENTIGFSSTTSAGYSVSSEIINSTAYNNSETGFVLQGSARVIGGTAFTNEYLGFQLYDTSSAQYSVSHDNGGWMMGDGFWLSGSSSVTHSEAYNNVEGFVLEGMSTVSNSRAHNNIELGFRLYQQSSVTNSYSHDNEYIGFYLYHNSTVTNSSAYGNQDGFLQVHTSLVENSHAYQNSRYGFWFLYYARIRDSTSRNNLVGVYGASQYELASGIAYNMDVSNNIEYGAIVQGPSQLRDGGVYCNPGATADIMLTIQYAGAPQAVMQGAFRANTVSGVGDTSQATILPCQSPRPGSREQIAME